MLIFQTESKINMYQEQNELLIHNQQQQEARGGGPGITSAAGRSRNVGNVRGPRGGRKSAAANVRGTTSGKPGSIAQAARDRIFRAQAKEMERRRAARKKAAGTR
jgi:hypothetical protein